MSVSEPSKILTPWATSGLKNTIPPTADPVTGSAGYDQGFPAINMTAKEAGGIPPFGQDFNGILFSITEILRYMQAGGIPTFSSAMSSAIGGYGKGAVVLGADGVTVFQNTVDGNTSNPNSGGSGWVKDVFSGYPVGAPIPWPTDVPPSGFLSLKGQPFSPITYPKLALVYPSLVLPDLRARFIRALDDGLGVDSGRTILSIQGDQIKSHSHSYGSPHDPTFGMSSFANVGVNPTASSAYYTGSFGGNETRPTNIAFLYIVRAA